MERKGRSPRKLKRRDIMLHVLNSKTVLIGSLVFMSIMFVIVMFFVNPSIDGGNGIGVIKLQLSFDKETGIEVIDGWGKSGIEHFKQWIFTDYIYAFSYSVFFASLLSYLIVKKGKETLPVYKSAVYLAFLAGLFDWVENTIELFFVNNPSDLSNTIFSLHSIFAVMKWAAIPIAVTYIVVLLTEKNKSSVQSR
jgi:hypothetical protein